jgi:ribosome-binding ATPase YchF (GTP1/OBG family)
MSEETTTTSITLAAPDNHADGGGQQPDKGVADKTFTQAELDAEIAKRLERERAKTAKAAEDAESERKRKEAETAGQWEEVNRQLTAENVRLKAEKAEAEKAALRLKVATELGLPVQLADRLKGDDEEAMKADAKTILDLLPKAEKTTPVGNGVNPKPQGIVADSKAADAARLAQARLYKGV